MLLDPPKASEWARTVPAEDARLRLLEAHVVRTEPKLLKKLGGAVKIKGAPWAQGVWSSISVGLLLAVLVMPVAGMTAFMAEGDARYRGARTPDWSEETQLILGVVCFGITLAVLLVYSFGEWLAAQRFWDGGIFLLIGYPGVFAVITLAALNYRGIDVQASVELLPMWLIIMCFFVIGPVMFLFSKRGSDHERQQFVRVLGRMTEEKERAVADEVAALPSQRRLALLEERDRVLQVLVDRGVVKESVREDAKQRDLGALHRLDAK